MGLSYHAFNVKRIQNCVWYAKSVKYPMFFFRPS